MLTDKHILQQQYILANLKKIFIDGFSSFHSGPMWFVLTLWFISLLFYLVHQLNGKYILGVAIFSSIIGYLCYLCEMNAPVKIGTVFTCFPFYSIGFLLKNKLKESWNKRELKFMIIAILCIVMSFLIMKVNGKYFNFGQLHNNDLGNYILFYSSALIGTIGLLFVFNYVFFYQNIIITILSYPLKFIGKYALVFLGTHWFLFYTVFSKRRLSGREHIARFFNNNNLNIFSRYI
jgi:hypothetical protein